MKQILKIQIGELTFIIEQMLFVSRKQENAYLYIISILSLHPNSESELGHLILTLSVLL
jgi:hypothetical protein